MFVPRDSLISNSLALFDAVDSFDHLTRSMQDLTEYADRIAHAVAAPENLKLGSDQADLSVAAGSRKRKASQKPSPQDLRLLLRPRIDWRDASDGFILTAVTPGLRKDELKVEVVDESGQAYLEVSGQTASEQSPGDAAPADGGDNDKAADGASDNKTNGGKQQELRATYRAFRERVRLPQGMDRDAMRASYEDGLLVVTIPRAKTENVRRQSIAIS